MFLAFEYFGTLDFTSLFSLMFSRQRLRCYFEFLHTIMIFNDFPLAIRNVVFLSILSWALNFYELDFAGYFDVFIT